MKPTATLVIASWLPLLVPAIAEAESPTEPVTAILGAMDIETAPLLRAMQDKRYEHHLNITWR